MSVSRQSFLAAHWDWLVTLFGVLALVAAGALFALKMGDTESADAYAQSLNAMRPAHEGVAPVDLDVLRKALRGAEKPPQLAAVDPRKANFLASERRVLCRQGDSSSQKKACGKPIPADCEVCPFCGAQQAIVKVEVDTDHDGMPNDWEKKYGFNPNDPSDAAKDADGDGFTNLEEYQAGTDPRDPKSHPDYLDSVTVSGGIRQTTLPFYFNAVTPIPGGHRFTFQRHGVTGYDAKVFVKLHEEIRGEGKNAWASGWTIEAYEPKQELRLRPGTKMKVPTDVSTVDVRRKSDGKTLKIRINDRTIAVESQVQLRYNRGEGRDIVVSEGTEFKVNECAYRVTKLKGVNGGCEVTIRDLQTKKEKTVR